jgi:hypothetical protein
MALSESQQHIISQLTKAFERGTQAYFLISFDLDNMLNCFSDGDAPRTAYAMLEACKLQPGILEVLKTVVQVASLPPQELTPNSR